MTPGEDRTNGCCSQRRCQRCLLTAVTAFRMSARKAAQTSGGLVCRVFKIISTDFAAFFQCHFLKCLLRPCQFNSEATASSLLKQLANILRDNDLWPFADGPVLRCGSRQEGMRLARADLQGNASDLSRIDRKST